MIQASIAAENWLHIRKLLCALANFRAYGFKAVCDFFNWLGALFALSLESFLYLCLSHRGLLTVGEVAAQVFKDTLFHHLVKQRFIQKSDQAVHIWIGKVGLVGLTGVY